MQPWSKLAKMAPDAVRSMQDSLISSVIKESAAGHPYYSQVLRDKNIEPADIKGTGDLVKLPFTTKKDIEPTENDRFLPKKFVLEKTEEAETGKKKGFFGKLFKKKEEEDDADPYRLLQLFYSGGRTGKIVPIVYTSHDIKNLKEIGERAFDMWDIKREDTTVNAMSYSPHVSYWQMFYSTMINGSTALQTGGGRVLGMEKILKALFNLEAQLLITFPGYADFALQVLERYGFPMPSLEKIVLGMDDIPMSMVDRVRKGMEAVNAKDNKVFRSYFLSEAKGGWPECEPGYGYHINPDHCFVEIIDPETGERKGEGEPGEIVVTNLDAKGTVFLRFRSGDIATGGIVYEPCKGCGRTMPRLLGDIERINYFFDINTGDGKKTFNFNQLRRSLYGISKVSQWYTEISSDAGKDTVKVVMCPKKDVSEDELKGDVENLVKEENPGIPFAISFSSIEDIVNRIGIEKNITDNRMFDAR